MKFMMLFVVPEYFFEVFFVDLAHSDLQRSKFVLATSIE